MSASARLASDATSSSSRLVSPAQATVRADRLRFALCSRNAWPSDASGGPSLPPHQGCRRARSSIDGEPSFSTHLPLCSAGLTPLRRSYEEIRLLDGHRPVVVASFRPTVVTDLPRPPRVRTLDVPPPPLPLPPQPRLDFGRRVRRHARWLDRPAQEFTCVRCCGPPRASSPHDLAAPASRVSRRAMLRAVASGSRLLPTRPVKDFHLQSSAHAGHTPAGAFSS
jgi:hypothetical protein